MGDELFLFDFVKYFFHSFIRSTPALFFLFILLFIISRLFHLYLLIGVEQQTKSKSRASQNECRANEKRTMEINRRMPVYISSSYRGKRLAQPSITIHSTANMYRKGRDVCALLAGSIHREKERKKKKSDERKEMCVSVWL